MLVVGVTGVIAEVMLGCSDYDNVLWLCYLSKYSQLTGSVLFCHVNQIMSEMLCRIVNL